MTTQRECDAASDWLEVFVEDAPGIHRVLIRMPRDTLVGEIVDWAVREWRLSVDVGWQVQEVSTGRLLCHDQEIGKAVTPSGGSTRIVILRHGCAA